MLPLTGGSSHGHQHGPGGSDHGHQHGPGGSSHGHQHGPGGSDHGHQHGGGKDRQTAAKYWLYGILIFVLIVFLTWPKDNRSVEQLQEASTPLNKRPKCSTAIDPSKITILSWSPRIAVYRNFVSDAECNYLLRNGHALGLTRSTVLSSEGTSWADQERTSSGVFLAENMTNNFVVRTVEERIARWTRIPSNNGEHFYLLRYAVGQEYRAHHDAFELGHGNHSAAWGSAGTRIATVLIYLGAPEEGGETSFPLIGLDVPVVRGDAVLFWTFDAAGQWDPLSLHVGKRVLKGVKYCMTKWIRISQYARRIPLEYILPVEIE